VFKILLVFVVESVDVFVVEVVDVDVVKVPILKLCDKQTIESDNNRISISIVIVGTRT
jgi:hypothetical protein